MRLALRRGASTPDAVTPAEPSAAFAGVLDGGALWVAVAAQPGRLALRQTDTGEVLDLPAEPVTDQPAYLGARIDLTGLEGTEGTYDVVLVPPGGEGHAGAVTLSTGPLAPTSGRTSGDGRTQHTLVRTPEESLRLDTRLLPAAAGLIAVRRLGEAIELTLVDAGPELAVLGEDDQVLVSWPVDERGVVTITTDSVAHLDPLTRPARTGRPGDWRPVRRRANDLLDPRAAAPLPQLDQPGADRPRLRLPWSREALLLVRVFAADEPGPGS